MMYCANCGTKIESDRCAVCGAESVPPPSTTAHVGRRDPVTGLALAEWGLRVGATIVDGLVLLVPEFLILLAIGLRRTFTTTNPLYFNLAVLAVGGLYSVYFLSRPRGQTIGNRAAKTRVVSASSGDSLTFKTSIIRWLVIGAFSFSYLFYVGVLLAPLDYLWPLWDPRRQTLHDKIAGTIVVLV